MATKRQVERKLRELIKRLDESDGEVRTSLAGALPESKVIHVQVSDLGLSYWSELSAGGLGSLHEGDLDRPDIRVRLTSDDLMELVDGRTSLFAAYLSGRVHIDASFGDLLRLRRLA